MKKIFVLSTLVSMLFVGCTSFEDKDNIIIQSDKQLSAGFAEETRTYVENDKYLRWHEDDQLTVFYGNTLNDQYRFKGKTGDNSGTFALVPSGELGTGNTLPSIYGIYPYNADARITDDGVITYSLPATQLYAENSFGKGANTMIAVTESVNDTFLSFKNLCGYLKLKLYGDATIKSIEVKGNFGEKIAGNASITASYGETPSFTMNNDATDTITLNCGDGVTLGTTADEATVFWIVIPETTFKYGITITATSTDNKVFTKSTSNSVVIERNTPLPMSALEFVGEEGEVTPISTFTIIYTTDDGNIVDLFTTEGFGAEYVSNVYDKESNIGTITFDGEITTIPAEAFLVCSNLTSIQIPNSVTTIAERAFYGCNYMEKIIIPESVTTITETAFERCSGEAHIYCNINDKAFVGSLFSKVVLDDSVTSLGKECFMNCTDLKDVRLSKGLTTIPYCAFQNTAIENIIIPKNIVSLEEGAFYQCYKLKTVVIPEGVLSLGDYVFADCRLLTEIKMPANMESLGSQAFLNCTSLIECIVPEGISSIKQKTFHNCVNLTSLSLPSTLTTLSGAFYGCNKLSRLNLTDIDAWLKVKIESVSGFLGGESPFDFSQHGEIYVNGELLTELAIPNNIIEIPNYIFAYTKSLQTITWGSRVSRIGDSAFYMCSNLDVMPLPKSLSELGTLSIAGTAITEVVITSMLSSSGLKGCEQLTTVSFAEDITSIKQSMFEGCVSLSHVIIPQNITSIQPYAFCGCINLKEITIPSSVQTLGEYSFYGCKNLEKVFCQPITPPRITFFINIGGNTSGYMFKDCHKDFKVYVPESSLEIYKSTKGWSDYLNQIIGKNYNE